MHKLDALLIGGAWPELMVAALNLLTRTGFTVDVISTNPLFKRNRSIRDYSLAKKNDVLLKIASEKIKKEYALVVIGDDPTLGKILHSDLSIDEKLALLPVTSKEHLAHVFSKTGLSQAFRKNGLLTPDFRIANDEEGLRNAARELGHPLFIKLDSASGGTGIFESSDPGDLENAIGRVKAYPVLVQKKVQGIEVSMEAFYQNGKLIHFAYSIPEKYKYRFGPTTVRRYIQLSLLEQRVFDDLGLLGSALGAHGFVNISSIRSNIDGNLYFFEADMRPNLWLAHPRYFGDDPARVIRTHFLTGATLEQPYPFDVRYPPEILLPHALRIGLGDLLLNRYQVWKHLPENFFYFMLRYRVWGWARQNIVVLYKSLLPKPYRAIIKVYLASMKYSLWGGGRQ
ncbi:Carbamoylphosphate synthase large subunit [Nitrosospira sp. Nsp13]|nr:Carbamoylphosphate synthase large subunit [Nitrosospira sp. Nsp13]